MSYKSDILKVTDQTHDVKSFRLSKPIGFSFIPGQYAMFDINSLMRPFTFSNSPSDDYLEITVKLMRNATKQLFSMKPADSITFRGPLGSELNFDENVKEPVAFIAGGSGITPFMSALRYTYTKKLENKPVLFYSNRTWDDIIFHAELGKMGFKVIHTLTASHPPSWKGETGFLDEHMLRRHIEPQDYIWYICGPPAMNNAMKKMLKQIGIKSGSIHIEPWELPGR